MKYLNKLSLRNAPRGALLFDPISAGALAGIIGGSSALNLGVGQLLGRSNMNKQNELQRENMKLANEFNRQNALEQGTLQRMALQGAGLNINSDKGTFQVAGASPLPTQVQQNPQVSDGVGMAQAVIGAQDSTSRYILNEGLADKAHAEAEDIRAGIPGTRAGAAMQEMRLDRYSEILGNEITQGEENINLTKEQQLSEQKKREEIDKNIKFIDEKISEVRASVRKMDAETAYTQMKTVWEKKEMQAHISELYALADYHKKAGAAAVDTAKAALKNAAAALKDASTRAMLAPSEKERNIAEADIAKIQKGLTEKYGDAQRISDIVAGFVGTAASCFFAAGAAKMLFKGGASVVRGFQP